MSLKYTLERFRWVKILFSPFKPFTIKWYFGKTAIGTPYFYPRKWVKATPELAYKAASEEIERQEKWNKLNPEHARKVKLIGELFHEKLKYKFAVPIKVGFDWCSLGYKTKWTDTDFRYEWPPIFTFVFFGYQIAAIISPTVPDATSHYWEAWLYYEYATDKTKSKRKRVRQCRKRFPQTWRVSSQGKEEVIDYYEHILKPKYLK